MLSAAAWDAMCIPSANNAIEPNKMPVAISTTIMVAVTAMTRIVRTSPGRFFS